MMPAGPAGVWVMESSGGRRKLGRGLSALLGPATTTTVTKATGAGDGGAGAGVAVKEEAGAGGVAAVAATNTLSDNGLRYIPVDQLDPNRFQPRKEMAAGELEALVASVRSSGVIQPILGRPGANGRVEIIAGERRWRAAMGAGLGTVPVVVRSASDLEAAEWALVENLQRSDLNAIEQAEAMRQLVVTFGLTQAAVAERLGMERPSVSNLMRLLELEEPIRGLIASGVLSAGHGKALLSAPGGEGRVGLARRASTEQWSVRRLERECGAVVEAKGAGGGGVRAGVGPGGEGGVGGTTASRAVADLERRLGSYLGTRVVIRRGRGGTRGMVGVEFYDLDHFDDLMRRMGFTGGAGSAEAE